ncbi:uncharacterized protein LOC143274636 [Babylonia areolata]|uniref:uncharacterized protein LOC143274636 n=1 Tax=Babylonia areolata TaxID=304850 RepID=UPI003FD24484
MGSNPSGGQRTTCEDIAQNQQLEWAFRINGSVRVLATCNTPNQPCDIVNPTILTATRDMSSSTATFVANATRQTPGGAAGYSGYDVICRYVAVVDPVSPVLLTSCMAAVYRPGLPPEGSTALVTASPS